MIAQPLPPQKCHGPALTTISQGMALGQGGRALKPGAALQSNHGIPLVVSRFLKVGGEK